MWINKHFLSESISLNRCALLCGIFPIIIFNNTEIQNPMNEGFDEELLVENCSSVKTCCDVIVLNSRFLTSNLLIYIILQLLGGIRVWQKQKYLCLQFLLHLELLSSDHFYSAISTFPYQYGLSFSRNKNIKNNPHSHNFQFSLFSLLRKMVSIYELINY